MYIYTGETGRKLWANLIEKQGFGLLELLALFPSCHIPLYVFLSCCPIMRPRYYSICSSPLLYTDCIHIALSLEYFICQMDSPSPVGGHSPIHDTTSTSSVKPPPPPPIYYRK